MCYLLFVMPDSIINKRVISPPETNKTKLLKLAMKENLLSLQVLEEIRNDALVLTAAAAASIAGCLFLFLLFSFLYCFPLHLTHTTTVIHTSAHRLFCSSIAHRILSIRHAHAFLFFIFLNHLLSSSCFHFVLTVIIAALFSSLLSFPPFNTAAPHLHSSPPTLPRLPSLPPSPLLLLFFSSLLPLSPSPLAAVLYSSSPPTSPPLILLPSPSE